MSCRVLDSYRVLDILSCVLDVLSCASSVLSCTRCFVVYSISYRVLDVFSCARSVLSCTRVQDIGSLFPKRDIKLRGDSAKLLMCDSFIAADKKMLQDVQEKPEKMKTKTNKAISVVDVLSFRFRQS